MEKMGIRWQEKTIYKTVIGNHHGGDEPPPCDHTPYKMKRIKWKKKKVECDWFDVWEEERRGRSRNGVALLA